MIRSSLTALIVALCAVDATAEVTRVDVRRADVGMSGYEKIVGTIYFAIDPKEPRQPGHRRARQSAAQLRRPRRVLGRPLHPAAAQREPLQRGRAHRRREPRPQDDADQLQPRRHARSRDRGGSRRRLPDAPGLHAGVGRVAVRRAAEQQPDGHRRAARRRRDRHGACRVHAERSQPRHHGGRSRRVSAGRRRQRRHADGTRRSLRRAPGRPARTLPPEGQRRVDGGRVRARTHVSDFVSHAEPGHCRRRSRGVSRHGVVAEVQPVRARPAAPHDRVRFVAEWTVSPDVLVSGIQHRRTRPPGVRRCHGAHRRRRAAEHQRAVGRAEQPRKCTRRQRFRSRTCR